MASKVCIAFFGFTGVLANTFDPPQEPSKVVYKLSVQVDKGEGIGCTQAAADVYVKDLINEWDRVVQASGFTLTPSPNNADVQYPAAAGRVHLLDTDDAALRKGGYIFRWRWDLDGSPDQYGATSDFTFKRRSDVTGVPTEASWVPMYLADGASGGQIKWKKQYTNEHVDVPLSSQYVQYKTKKDKYTTVSELQTVLDGADFLSATVADWEKAFPFIREFASTSASAVVSPHGLGIYEYEVLVGDSSNKFRFKLSKDGETISKKMEPSIVLWCDQDAGAEAFAGELQWSMDYEDDAAGFVDFFAEMVKDGLGGYAGGVPKTSSAYDKMNLNPGDTSVEGIAVL